MVKDKVRLEDIDNKLDRMECTLDLIMRILIIVSTIILILGPIAFFHLDNQTNPQVTPQIEENEILTTGCVERIGRDSVMVNGRAFLGTSFDTIPLMIGDIVSIRKSHWYEWGVYKVTLISPTKTDSTCGSETPVWITTQRREE